MPGETAKRKMPQRIASEARQKLTIGQRRQEAYRLWFDEKKNLREIGEQLGVSHETIRSDLNAVVTKIADEFDDEIRTMRSRQIGRLMKQYDRFDRIAANEKAPPASRTKAGTLCLGILKELSDITGVRAAQKVEHTGKDGQPIQQSFIVEIVNGTNGTTDTNTDE